MVDVLQVLKLFQAVDQAHDLLRVVGGHLGGRGGLHRHFGALDLHTLLLKSLLHGHEVGRLRVDDPLVVGVLVVVGAGLDDRHLELFLIGSGAVGAHGVLLVARFDFLLDHDLALALEHVGNRAGSAQVAARMRECRAHVGGSAVAVVGQGLAVNGDAAGTVALVHDGFVVRGVLARTESLVDGGLDLVLGQRVALGLLDGGGQRRVVVGVRVATLLGCNGDVARQLGEQGGALSVLRGLAVFRGCPL